MKKYLELFRSVKFNVWLFCALALASVLGTLIPQVPENPERVQEFVAKYRELAIWMDRAQLFNIYYSWWFIAMLGLMAFDVIVCKLIFGKFPGFRVFKAAERKAAVALGQPFRKQGEISRPLPEAEAGILRALARNGYALSERHAGEDGSVLLLASRHRPQRFGSWVSHISILLVLLANFAGALYGFRETVNIPEGTSQKLRNRPWLVSCDKFIAEWYPGTSTPKTFASDLRLFVKGQVAGEKRILVNEPLEYKKVRFYQATYGPYLKEARIGLFLRDDPKRSPPAVSLRLGEEARVPGTPYSLRILQFIPDFSLNEKQEIVSRSVLPQNPAIQILVSKDGKPIKAPWIFEHDPLTQMPPIQAEDEFVVVLAEYIPSFYTGLQVTYDPGADLFWLACAILVAGLMLLFYLHHRKVWVALAPSAAGTALSVGASSSRGASFEGEFLRLFEDLQGAR
jgi:cytochrome c biogenesis protein